MVIVRTIQWPSTDLISAISAVRTDCARTCQRNTIGDGGCFPTAVQTPALTLPTSYDSGFGAGREVRRDPRGLRTRVGMELHAETGDRTFARPLVRIEADGHLWRGVGFGAALAAGTGFGAFPAPHAWQIGGATTVRGHEAGSYRGESLWLARGEVTYGPPLIGLAVFGDAGWAGARSDLWDAQPLRSLGIGMSLLGDLLRVDLAKGLDGGDTRLYLRIGGPS